MWVEGKKIVLEPVPEPPPDIFVESPPEIAEAILREAKDGSDKAVRLLRELSAEPALGGESRSYSQSPRS